MPCSLTPRRSLVLASSVLVLLVACGETPPPPEPDPGFLETPFSAEQIRDEWIPGFALRVRYDSPQGPQWQVWTVRRADESGAEIEFAPIDREGKRVGEPFLQFSSWEELRDHAAFPSAAATRELATETTELGELEGWVYVVQDAVEGTSSRYFFARDLPGAPISMVVTRDGELVESMTQERRSRP